MVICPCVVMLPASSRRETKIPMRKWDNITHLPKSESKHKIENDKFPSIVKPGFAFRNETVNPPPIKPLVITQPLASRNETEGSRSDSSIRKEQNQKYFSQGSLSFLPKNVSPQPFKSVQQNKSAPKAETLVLSNGKGRYVGTTPLTSNLNSWSSLPRKENKLKNSGSSSVDPTSSRLKSPPCPKVGDVTHPNQSTISTLKHEANRPSQNDNTIKNYKCVTGREAAVKPPMTVDYQFSKQTPSFQERRLQFRQSDLQGDLQPNLQCEKETSNVPSIHQAMNKYSSSSTVPRVPVIRRNDPSRRSSCGFQIERDNNFSADCSLKSRFDKDVQNLKKLHRNSLIDYKIPFNEHDTLYSAEFNRQSNLITLESPPVNERKRPIPLIHDSTSSKTSMRLNRTKDFYLGLPSVALDWKKMKENNTNAIKDNVGVLEVESCEGSGEAMASSNVLSALELEDCFEVTNIEDDQKDLSKALSDIQEELMSRSDETLLDGSVSMEDRRIPDINNSSSDDFESFYELPPKSFHSSSPNSDSSWSPWVDDLLQESFQSLQKEVQSLNKIMDSEEEINLSRPQNGFTLSDLKQQEYDDEDDYIDVDCDVPPMANLRHPLGYDFLNRITGRKKEFLEPSRYSCNVDDCKCYCNQKQNAYEQPTEEEVKDNFIAQSNFRETYWDYWLAKNKLQHLKSTREFEPSEPLSVTIGKHCCAPGKVHYDPEILLAQIIHPKSLADATFSEYSSHVKSSILKRLAIQEYEKNINSDRHFGSCFDIPERINGPMTAAQHDPGYFSESDACKRRINERKKVYNDPYHDGHVLYNPPPLSSRLTASIPRTKFPDHRLSDCRIAQKSLLQDENSLIHSSEFPYSYHHYHENKSTRDSIGENPWIHLLTDITPPRTPMKDSTHADKDYHNISNSPSITSLPDYSIRKCNNYGPSQHIFDNPVLRDRPRPTSAPPKGIKEQKSSTTDESNKKTRKKSFLPTFLKKKKTGTNPVSSSTTDKNDGLISQQLSSHNRREKPQLSSFKFNNASPKPSTVEEPTNSRVGLVQKPLITCQQKKKNIQNSRPVYQPYQKSLFHVASELTSNSSSSSSSTKSSQDSVRTVISCVAK